MVLWALPMSLCACQVNFAQVKLLEEDVVDILVADIGGVKICKNFLK